MSAEPSIPLVYRLQRVFFAACMVLGTAAIVVAATTNPPYCGSGPGIASAIARRPPMTAPAPPRPAYRVLQAVLLATCIVLAPLLMASWFALCPQYGNPGCPDTANPLGNMVAYRAASPALLHAFLLVNVLVPYLFSLSYLALGIVAMRRSPWLSTLGMLCGWLASAPWGLVTDRNYLLADMARMGNDGPFAALITRLNAHPEIVLMAAGWFFGHMLGYVFLGLALGRAQVVPRWAASLMVIAVPLMGPIAYGTGQGDLQVLGFLLVFVASVPAAAAMLGLASHQGRSDPLAADVAGPRTPSGWLPTPPAGEGRA